MARSAQSCCQHCAMLHHELCLLRSEIAQLRGRMFELVYFPRFGSPADLNFSCSRFQSFRVGAPPVTQTGDRVQNESLEMDIGDRDENSTTETGESDGEFTDESTSTTHSVGSSSCVDGSPLGAFPRDNGWPKIREVFSLRPHPHEAHDTPVVSSSSGTPNAVEPPSIVEEFEQLASRMSVCIQNIDEATKGFAT